MTRPLSCSLLVLCLALAIPPLAAQTVYHWKDAKGVTHYSDSPPPKGATRREMRIATSTPATPVPKQAARGEAPTPTVAAVATQAQAAGNARCAQARLNLTNLQGSAAVGLDANGDGKPDATLSPEDRAKQIQFMQEAIKANCPGGG